MKRSKEEKAKPQEMKAYYMDYLYQEVFLLDEDIEAVPESGYADNACSLIADKIYVQKQFENRSFDNLKDVVCKLCDEPEIETRHDAIMFLVWMAALGIKEELTVNTSQIQYFKNHNPKIINEKWKQSY